MVSSAELIATSLLSELRQYKAQHIVVDPVMVATSGAKLVCGMTPWTALTAELLPLAEAADPQHPGGRDPRPA